ncbi:MAG: glycosyltransferase family 4 protein [Patescibacteria group bacterium]
MIGGAEVAVKEITDRLPEHEFEMVTLQFDPSHPKVERIGNVVVHRINTSKLMFPFEASFYGKSLHKEKKFDAIWSIMAAYAGFASLFFKMSHPEVPYILTLQEGDPIESIKAKTWFVSPIFRKIFMRADKIQAISYFLADFAEAMGYKGKVEVIPNGVDYKSFAELPDPHRMQEILERFEKKDTETYLITTSRLVKKNGIDDVIKAVALLPKTVKFLILGTGPDQKILESLARRCGVETQVKFLGYVEYKNIPLYLHASDIFIRPSLSEGFGNSFIEAMAAGLPVIATAVGGIIDFVFDPDKDHDMPPTGLFVNVKDPESIKTQILRLIDDKELREKLVSNGKKLAEEKYDWNLVAKEMRERIFTK